MTVMTPTALRKNLFEVVNNTAKYNDVVCIPGKEGNVIMMSEDDYRGMLETMYLESQPGVVEEILAGIKEPIEDGFVLEGRLE